MQKFAYDAKYSLFMPGKSWIFVNPSIGCPLNCSYCIEQKDSWFENELKEIYSPKETLDKIFNSPLILKDKSPLTFYNFSDPFLSRNRQGLLTILKELDEKNWKNKIGLISKIHPGKKYLQQLLDFQNLKIGLFVSYANLIQGLESVSYARRVDLMKDARKLGIKVVDYVRPLVAEWISEDRLVDLANQIKGKVDAVSLSGIRLTPEIVKILISRGLEVPNAKTYTNKQRDNSLSTLATEIINEIVEVPVFWHTSCAMSYLFQEPDYNSHDIREKRQKDNCEFPCINTQRIICNKRDGITSDNKMNDLIKRLGKEVTYNRDGDTFLLSGDFLTKEDVSFIRHIIPEFVMKNG